jgi:hypothetical protein
MSKYISLIWYLTFWTTAPHFFCKFLLESLLKIFLQIVKGIWIKLREAFSRFEIFSPYFKCFSFDLNKTPPQWNSPLSIQEGFRYQFWKRSYQFEIISKIRCSLKNFFNTNWKIAFKNFLKLVVVRSFCFGLILSPPLAWIAKNGYFVSEIWALLLSPPMVHKNMSKDYTNVRVMRSDGEGF